MAGPVNVEIWRDLPPSGRGIYYYPGATTSGGAMADGLLLRVSKTSGEHWYAMCAGHGGAAEGIFQFKADPSRFVVWHKGSGYRIAYDEPEMWEELPLSGLARHAVYNADSDILMLFDWISGVGLGAHGFVWETPRLFSDDLEVVETSCDSITLRGDELGATETVILAVRDGSFLSGKPSRFN